MKLISVQSRGNRIARIKLRRPYLYVYGLMISNPFRDNEGWISRIKREKHIDFQRALKAAKQWLEGAKP